LVRYDLDIQEASMPLRRLVPFGIACFVIAGAAQAQVSRVFVSVSGNDANTCSNIATPCRTLVGGITQVDAQGEVIVVDSGSYAGGAITKSVKINVAAGAVAFSGLPITVNPGAGGVVVLRGLTLKAATVGLGTGISHQSGVLFLENMVVDGWSDGVSTTGGAERLFVKDSVFRNQSFDGLYVQPGSTVVASVDDSFFEYNGFVGIEVRGGEAYVSNSVISGNDTGVLLFGIGTRGTFQRCEVRTNSFTGFNVQSNAVLRVSYSTIVKNSTGLFNASSTVESFGNNVIRGNGTDINGSVTPVALQ
jgi:hypothetical protein